MFLVAPLPSEQPVQTEDRVDMKLCGPTMAEHSRGVLILALFNVASSNVLVTVPEMKAQP